MPKPINIFFAYARADQTLRDELDKHLAFLRRSKLIKGWYDGNISAGEDWQQAINQHLHTADIILLLISPDFIASDYCYDVEMKKAMARHEAGEAVFIPVILRPCVWKYAPFGKLQALPQDAKPISRWADSDDAFDNVATTIDTVVRQLQKRRSTPPTSSAQPTIDPPAPSTPITPQQDEIEVAPLVGGLGELVEHILPSPFAWIKIPAGQVTIEGKTLKVEPFAIAKYSLTNAQFAPFIKAGGYKEKKWWTEAGWAKCQQEKWIEPRYWQDEKWNGAERPVVGVSWYEAVAYCRWLSHKTKQKIMLPTEAQWQYAAQGDDGREYPWGNEWDSSRCQNRVGGGLGSAGRTTPVTTYEGKGDSPFGVVDLAGNVWEWCLTEYHSGSDDLNGTNVRVLRGGSWDYYDSNTSACRTASGTILTSGTSISVFA